MGLTVEMIDLHCHILPGLDDGPRSMEESIDMCWIAYQDGIRTIVATPHTLNGIFQNNKSTILKSVEELYSELRTQHSELSLNILPGSDAHLCEITAQQIGKGDTVTLGDGGKYLLVEFPYQGIPFQVERILFQLMNQGITPIISHPERNFEIMERPGRYYEMIKMGCLGQVTAMSLTGDFGKKTRQSAEKLLKHGLVQFIASDGHSVNGRPPVLSNGVKAAAKIVGKEEAWRMVTEYPRTILDGRRFEVPEPRRP